MPRPSRSPHRRSPSPFSRTTSPLRASPNTLDNRSENSCSFWRGDCSSSKRHNSSSSPCKFIDCMCGRYFCSRPCRHWSLNFGHSPRTLLLSPKSAKPALWSPYVVLMTLRLILLGNVPFVLPLTEFATIYSSLCFLNALISSY